MQFLTVATLFVAGLAAANPTANARRSKAHSVSTAAAAQQCGKDQKISCCNSGNGSILGLNCVMVPILAIPLLDSCSGSNVASCCSTNQDGSLNINLPCIPLGL